jgi:hypothetical protein
METGTGCRDTGSGEISHAVEGAEEEEGGVAPTGEALCVSLAAAAATGRATEPHSPAAACAATTIHTVRAVVHCITHRVAYTASRLVWRTLYHASCGVHCITYTASRIVWRTLHHVHCITHRVAYTESCSSVGPGVPLARGSAWAGGRDHTPSRVPQRWGTTSCRNAAPLTHTTPCFGTPSAVATQLHLLTQHRVLGHHQLWGGGRGACSVAYEAWW